MYVRACVYICVCTYVFMYMSVRECICIYVCVYSMNPRMNRRGITVPFPDPAWRDW